MPEKFTMLIAEDDIISYELYKIRLEEFDINLIHAKNGKVAVDLVKENPQIDLILMDIRMPVLNGYDATEQIRQFNTTVPIIAQTAFALIPDQQKILETGFNDFLPKPIEEVILFGMIRKYMSEKL